MKSLNAKRIAAVIAGAALLGAGLAFASPVTFQNVPIINNAGQPVVQVVIGSTAKPSDGVAAASISAAIGNLAYTTVPVTASVNATQAAAVLHPVVSSSSYTLSSQQVWLNESSLVYASGTYSFGALIGSVLNRAVQLGSPINTKTLQGAGSYAYPETNSLTSSPMASAYTGIFVPVSTSVSASTNGGGISFSSFVSGTNDNILQVGNAQLPALLSNAGTYGENEYLWLTGFPVFDQETSVNNFALLNAGGAYQVTFNKPIPRFTAANSVNNAQFVLLGQNWTILGSSISSPGVANALTTTTSTGGKLQLASSLSPITTVYVGHNVTSAPVSGFTVQLTDIGQPNANGVSPAAFNIYYNGALTNVTAIPPTSTVQFNVTGHTLFVTVSQTFAGLYAYQKYAKVQLYSNVFNVTSGSVFNKTTNPGWNVLLLWTNGTASSGSLGTPNELQSIVLYNTTPTMLVSGQSFGFVQSPTPWKLTFVGQTLTSSNRDTVQAVSSYSGGLQYANQGPSAVGAPAPTNITEPGQLLTITSSITNAFSFAGQTASSVQYDLTPYALTQVANSPTAAGVNVVLAGSFTVGNFVTSANPLIVTISGYTGPTGSQTSNSATFYDANSIQMPTAFYNITSVRVNRALPGIQINLYNGIDNSDAANIMTTFNSVAPAILYTQSGKSYLQLAAPGTVTYNQQNGQPTSIFSLTATNPSGTAKPVKYFTYTMNEIAVQSQSTIQDMLGFSMFNSTAGIAATPLFQLNYSTTGTRNNMTYTSSQGTAVNAQRGFVTERGSSIASIASTSLSVGMATSVDSLQFAVGPSTTTAAATNWRLFGPYGVGQLTNIANVSIASVLANVSVQNATFSVAGIDNLTAIANPATATVPVLLNSLTTTAGTPSALVVLDAQANPSSNLILVGSGYVNSLSQQLQSAYNVSMVATSVVAQAYGSNRVLVAGFTANQTLQATNTFISALYAAAST